MVKHKNKFIVLLTAVMLLSCLGIITASAKTYKTPLDLFETNNMQLSTDYLYTSGDSRSLLLSSTAIGASAKTASRMSGAFAADFRLVDDNGSYDLTDFSFRFTDANDTSNTFSVNFGMTGSRLNAYVSAKGTDAGIYYYANGLYGMTAGYNSQGDYTYLDVSGRKNLVFSPFSMQVSFSGRLIWDFSKQSNDSRDIGFVLSGFEEYTVEIVFGGIKRDKTAKLSLYSINSQKLDGDLLKDNAAPGLYARADYNAVAGQKYEIPALFANDVIDGKVPSTNAAVSVSDAAQNTILYQNYADGLSFTPQAAGEYTIKYILSDGAENTAMLSVAVKAYDKQPNTVFTLSSRFGDSTVGKLSALMIPSAWAANPLSLSAGGVETYVSVYLDGQAVSGYEEKSASLPFEFIFKETGVYEIRYFIDNGFVQSSESYFVTVDGQTPEIGVVNIADSMALNSFLTLPDLTMSLGGASADCSYKVIFPSGAAYANKRLQLTESGTYTVEFSAELSGVKYVLQRELSVSSKSVGLFSVDEGDLEIKNSVYSLNNDYKGVLVSQKAHQTLTYNRTINLSKMTKDDAFIDFIVQPRTIGKADFSQLVITLTDIYDEDNYLTIIVEDSSTINAKGALSFIRTGATGQTPGGIFHRWFLGRGTKWTGNMPNHSFMGTLYEEACGNVPLQSLKLCYDAGQNALYHKNTFDTYEILLRENAGIDKYIISDYDNPNYYPTLWDGFATGEVKMTINVKGVNASSADYMIISVDGNDLSDEYVKDAEPPEIELDGISASAPLGKVGAAYKLFDANCYDRLTDFKLETRVFYNYADNGGSEITVTDGSFTPLMAGVYTIVYTAVDMSGNVSRQKIDVTVKSDVDGIEIATVSDGDASGTVGKTVNIAKVEASGGAGGLNTSVSVTHESGKEIELYGDTFLPLAAGNYTVKYTAADYINTTKVYSYVINVVRNDTPVIDAEVYLPPAFVNGERYVLPAVSAYAYKADGSVVEVPLSIRVTDGKGKTLLDSGRVYIPQINAHGDIVTVEYFSDKEGGVSKTIDVTGLRPTEGSAVDMTKLFLPKDLLIESEPEFIKLTPSNSGASATFGKPLLANSFNLKFDFNKQKANVGYVKVTLTDIYSLDISVEFVIKNIGGTSSVMSINGGPDINVYGSFTEDSGYGFEIGFNNNSFAVSDSSGASRSIVKTTAAGSAFNGFSGQYVYMKIELLDVTGDTELQLTSINRQPLSSSSIDRIIPELFVMGNVGGFYSLGDSAIIPSAIGADVLNSIKSLTVTVKAPDGSYVTAKGGVVLNKADASYQYEIELTQYDAYNVQYLVTDNSRGEWSFALSKIISVTENEPPVLTVNGKVPASGNVNSAMTLPSATATDNIDGATKVYIICTAENGTTVLVGDDNKFTPTVAGEWKVKYYTFDSNYNYVIKEFVISVK